MHNTKEEHPARAHIQKELISNLMRKNRRSEIRDFWDSYGDQKEMQYQNKFWMKLYQMAEINAEEVKCVKK
jgi:hypothetical protein